MLNGSSLTEEDVKPIKRPKKTPSAKATNSNKSQSYASTNSSKGSSKTTQAQRSSSTSSKKPTTKNQTT